ncbi:hypothetical protein FRC17_000778 [Serendipita sp. 399]|nr:hypothetical protein FRC17_000778 [Serendipita sp. 399]
MKLSVASLAAFVLTITSAVPTFAAPIPEPNPASNDIMIAKREPHGGILGLATYLVPGLGEEKLLAKGVEFGAHEIMNHRHQSSN